VAWSAVRVAPAAFFLRDAPIEPQSGISLAMMKSLTGHNVAGKCMKLNAISPNNILIVQLAIFYRCVAYHSRREESQKDCSEYYSYHDYLPKREAKPYHEAGDRAIVAILEGKGRSAGPAGC
jgi:hypothetical protein